MCDWTMQVRIYMYDRVFCRWRYFQVQQSFAWQEAYVRDRICRCNGVIRHKHMFQYRIAISDVWQNHFVMIMLQSCLCALCCMWFFYAYHVEIFQRACILADSFLYDAFVVWAQFRLALFLCVVGGSACIDHMGIHWSHSSEAWELYLHICTSHIQFSALIFSTFHRLWFFGFIGAQQKEWRSVLLMVGVVILMVRCDTGCAVSAVPGFLDGSLIFSNSGVTHTWWILFRWRNIALVM